MAAGSGGKDFPSLVNEVAAAKNLVQPLQDVFGMLGFLFGGRARR